MKYLKLFEAFNITEFNITESIPVLSVIAWFLLSSEVDNWKEYKLKSKPMAPNKNTGQSRNVLLYEFQLGDIIKTVEVYYKEVSNILMIMIYKNL